MILREKIQELKLNKIPDGIGGVSVELTPFNFITCKISVSNDVAKATAYGVLTEQVLNVITFNALSKENFYLYQNKKYSVRGYIKKGRYYFSTLVEVA